MWFIAWMPTKLRSRTKHSLIRIIVFIFKMIFVLLNHVCAVYWTIILRGLCALHTYLSAIYDANTFFSPTFYSVSVYTTKFYCFISISIWIFWKENFESNCNENVIIIETWITEIMTTKVIKSHRHTNLFNGIQITLPNNWKKK